MIFPYIFLLVLACNQEPQPNYNLLSEDKMVEVLVEMHLTNGRLGAIYQNRDSAKAVFKKIENDFFESHQINKADYDSSYNHYLQNLTTLDHIYTRVIDSITFRESLLNTK